MYRVYLQERGRAATFYCERKSLEGALHEANNVLYSAWANEGGEHFGNVPPRMDRRTLRGYYGALSVTVKEEGGVR